jgi:hypothetical protein
LEGCGEQQDRDHRHISYFRRHFDVVCIQMNNI